MTVCGFFDTLPHCDFKLQCVILLEHRCGKIAVTGVRKQDHNGLVQVFRFGGNCHCYVQRSTGGNSYQDTFSAACQTGSGIGFLLGDRKHGVIHIGIQNRGHEIGTDALKAVRPGLACWKLGGTNQLTSATWTWNAQFESDIYYVENVSFMLDVKMVLKTVKVVFSKSEMRTNSDRVKFDGNNLLETRSRHEILEAEDQKQVEISQ